jgi:hypothetical protein
VLDHRPGVDGAGRGDVRDPVACAVANPPRPAAIVRRLDRSGAAGAARGGASPQQTVTRVPKRNRVRRRASCPGRRIGGAGKEENPGGGDHG